MRRSRSCCAGTAPSKRNPELPTRAPSPHYMNAQPSFRLTCVLTLASASVAWAQQTPAQQPPVKVNVLNVCTPTVDDQKELSSSLAKAPGNPRSARITKSPVATPRWTQVRRFLACRQCLPGQRRLPIGFVSGASFLTERSLAIFNIPLASTRRIWWRRWCSTCVTRKI